MITSNEVFNKLENIGLKVPVDPTANGKYELVKVYRGLAYVSGQLPRFGSAVNELMQGRLITVADLEIAQEAARLCFLRSLLALHHHLGDLSRIEEFVSIKGFLNAEPEFQLHAKVLDSVSSLALELFGKAGEHVRSALGAGSLPSGGLVELEVVVGIRDLP